jgi:hypothetical protein
VDSWEDIPLWAILTAADAQRIDLKMDDGKPGTGSETAPPQGDCSRIPITEFIWHINPKEKGHYRSLTSLQ